MIGELAVLSGVLVGTVEFALQASLHNWAVRTGIRVAELSGRIPPGVAILEVLPELGFRARAVDSDRILLRPVYWWERGRSADPTMRDTIAIMRTSDAAWQLEVRQSIATPLAVAAGGFLVFSGLGVFFGAGWLLMCGVLFVWGRNQGHTAFDRIARGLAELECEPAPRTGGWQRVESESTPSKPRL